MHTPNHEITVKLICPSEVEALKVILRNRLNTIGVSEAEFSFLCGVYFQLKEVQMMMGYLTEDVPLTETATNEEVIK